MSKKITSIYPRQNGKSTLALEFTRLQTELNEANYKLYTHRVKIGLLENENDKLKEMLKECRDLMNRAGYVFAKIEDVEKARNLLTKIDEVLK